MNIKKSVESELSSSPMSSKGTTMQYNGQWLDLNSLISKVESNLHITPDDDEYPQDHAIVTETVTAKWDSLKADRGEKQKFLLTADVMAEALEANGLKFNEVNGLWFTPSGRVTETEVVTILYCWFPDFKGVKVDKESITARLSKAKIDLALKEKAQLAPALAYDPSVDWKPVVQKMYNVLKIENCSVDAFGLALRQWMWQIKRKNLVRETMNQLVISFYSPLQGIGKTETTRAITKGLVTKTFWTTITMDTIIDRRNVETTNSKLIGVLDEYTYSKSNASNGNHRMDVEDYGKLKSFISENDAYDARILGTLSQMQALPLTSLIGSSNTHFWESMPVGEEFRRFVEFDTGRTRNDMTVQEWTDFKVWMQNNVILIAKSVDEDNDLGYWRNTEMPELKVASDEIDALQEGYRLSNLENDTITMFVKDATDDPSFGTHDEFGDWDSLYETFREFCRRQGYGNYTPTLPSFKSRLACNLHIKDKNSLADVKTALVKNVASVTEWLKD